MKFTTYTTVLLTFVAAENLRELNEGDELLYQESRNDQSSGDKTVTDPQNTVGASESSGSASGASSTDG